MKVRDKLHKFVDFIAVNSELWEQLIFNYQLTQSKDQFYF